MKTKKLFALTLALCTLLLSSCRDDKQKSPIGSGGRAEKPLTNVSENNDANNDDKMQDVNDYVDPLSLIESIDAKKKDDGTFYSDAVAFCEAIISANAKVVAQYTGGKEEYYDFLNEVTFDSYSFVPFEYSEQKLEEMSQKGKYPRADDLYLVTFNVSKSDSDYFTVGKSMYFLGFTEEAITGFGVKVFSPVDDTEDDVVFDGVALADETEQYIIGLIGEFYPFYESYGTDTLYDGKNFAESFDFSNQYHLITHIMAKTEQYGYPPYSLMQINDFISRAFNGNTGLDATDEEALKNWIYPFSDEAQDEDRIYGCSYAHGGTSAQSRLVLKETDEISAVYTYEMYADYARFAKAKTLQYHFELSEDDIPSLVMIYQTDNTGQPVATISV